MKIINCEFEAHGKDVLAIINDTIATSTWVYDYEPRSIQFMESYFADKAANGLPIVGAIDDSGALMGYGSYGQFRNWPGYKYTVEHSVYVNREFRLRGIGTALLKQLMQLAIQQDYHVMIGAIDSSSTPSIALHEKLGFSLAGTMKEVGFKHGQWLDAIFYQAILHTPAHPVDG